MTQGSEAFLWFSKQALRAMFGFTTVSQFFWNFHCRISIYDSVSTRLFHPVVSHMICDNSPSENSFFFKVGQNHSFTWESSTKSKFWVLSSCSRFWESKILGVGHGHSACSPLAITCWQDSHSHLALEGPFALKEHLAQLATPFVWHKQAGLAGTCFWPNIDLGPPSNTQVFSASGVSRKHRFKTHYFGGWPASFLRYPKLRARGAHPSGHLFCRLRLEQMCPAQFTFWIFQCFYLIEFFQLFRSFSEGLWLILWKIQGFDSGRLQVDLALLLSFGGTVGLLVRMATE